MFNILLSTVMIFLILVPDLPAAGDGPYIFHLKDGSVIRGKIVESDLEDRILIETEDGITIVLETGEIERVSEESAIRRESRIERSATRRAHGGYLMGAGIAMVAFGFIFNMDEFEMEGGGIFHFPNVLFLAGAALGISGLYLYSTANDSGKTDERSGQNSNRQFSCSGTRILYEW